jgi:hypothetical protein
MSRRKDLSGKRFGRLLVFGPVGSDGKGCRVYDCQCQCNRLTEVRGAELNRGRTRSCGQCGLPGLPWSEQALQEMAEWYALRERNWSFGAIGRMYRKSARAVWNRFQKFQRRLQKEQQVWYGGFTTEVTIEMVLEQSA